MHKENIDERIVEVAITDVKELDSSGEVVAEEVIVEFEDLEIHGRHGTKPHKAKTYRIVIDKAEKHVHQHEMTGRAILALVGKTPEAFSLSQKLHGGARERIEPDQSVEFHKRGVERFETSPKSATNG